MGGMVWIEQEGNGERQRVMRSWRGETSRVRVMTIHQVVLDAEGGGGATHPRSPHFVPVWTTISPAIPPIPSLTEPQRLARPFCFVSSSFHFHSIIHDHRTERHHIRNNGYPTPSALSLACIISARLSKGPPEFPRTHRGVPFPVARGAGGGRRGGTTGP